jgi:hypothetical protein
VEHIFILLVDGFSRVDRVFQKQAHQVIADVESLRADPATYLSQHEVTIGPRRRWIYATGCAFMLAFALQFLLFLVFVQTMEPPPRGGPRPWDRIALLGLLLLVILGVSLMLWLWLLKGGTCVVEASGVRFIKGDSEVFCPWALFTAPGQAVFNDLHGRNQLELPIAPEAIDRVAAKTNFAVVAEGMDVKTSYCRFRSGRELILANIYRLEPRELGELLLLLGRRLAPPQKAGTAKLARIKPATSRQSVATKGDWITVSLTGLSLPQECCECGVATASLHKFTCGNFNENCHIDVFIPLCHQCDDEFERRASKLFRKFALVFVAISALCGMLVAAWIAWADRSLSLLIFFVPTLAFSFGGGGFAVAMALKKWVKSRASPPVQLRRYRPDNSTVEIRFQNKEYAEQVIAG